MLASQGGHLTIRWRLEGSDDGTSPTLALEWVETGAENMPAAAAPAKGSRYGRELIKQALPYQLKARTTYDIGAHGVRCTIVAPIAFEGERKEHDGMRPELVGRSWSSRRNTSLLMS